MISCGIVLSPIITISFIWKVIRLWKSYRPRTVRRTGMSYNVIRRFIVISKMTDEEKKKKREKSWFEEFLYNVMMECTRIAIDYFFDELLG